MGALIFFGADTAGTLAGREALGQVAHVFMFAVYVATILGNCWLLLGSRRG